MQSKISKRQFLTRTVAAAIVTCSWEPLISFGKTTVPLMPRRLNLAGSWQVSQVDKNEWIPAVVPGCVHTDLLAAGKIPDPFYRDNEKAVQWVGESSWIYKRSFTVPPEVLKNDRVLLRCEGLDTLATVRINGKEIGRTDNMFRLWEFDVKKVLIGGENTIEILFRSPFDYIKERTSDQAPQKWVKERAWVRKAPCNFGWDWGPVLASCGISNAISLETFSQGRITDVLISQHHLGKKVELDVQVNTEVIPADKPFKAAVSVYENGRRIESTTVEIANNQALGKLQIKQPKLWWPVGMGKQPLYEVHIALLDAENKTVDTAKKRIGLRTMKVVLAEKDSPLFFIVNGVPFFAKGANCIPVDSFSNRVTPEICRRYVADAVAVNMNMLRFWGGGYYEEDAWFEACDELGICVWMDFKFACSAYPSFDNEFMENVRHEAHDNVRRLRHHACIAVWCGNNELSICNLGNEWSNNTMNHADYDKMFKVMLAQEVKACAPEANYVSGSPDCGDTHYWEVWHGPKTFDAYRTQNGFMSEFGYQSFPEPKTVHAFTNEEDRASVVSPVMKWHQRSGGLEGNQKMVDMINHYFNPPRNFETTLWLSQILQGYGIKTGAEYWRQTMPKSMGCVFWQYNDIWPGMSWSSVDYFGRWKALHYMARKFYAPVLVSSAENIENGTIDIFVTNDRLESRRGVLTWTVTDMKGKSLLQGSTKVEMAAQKSQKIKTLDVSGSIGSLAKNEVLTWLKLTTDGEAVSENLVLLALPKQLKLADPRVSTTIKETRDGFLVTLKSENPSLWTWLDLEDIDAKYSDNFVHITPNEPVNIFIRTVQKTTKEALSKTLRVHNLFSTYSPL